MNIHKATALASLAFLFFSASAQAEIQTWRLTSNTYQIQSGITPPAFAQIGDDFYIDYVVDTQTQSFPGWDGMFSDAVKSFSINGITSQSEGYISAHGGLNAINIWPSSSRGDGIDFLSLGNFSEAYAPDVTSALKDFADSVQTKWTDLRVDFGDKSIWAKPSSFVMTSSVPEPSSLLLVGLGVVGVIGLTKRRQQARPSKLSTMKKPQHAGAFFFHQGICSRGIHSTALTMSSTTFLASPNTIMVLSL